MKENNGEKQAHASELSVVRIGVFKRCPTMPTAKLALFTMLLVVTCTLIETVSRGRNRLDNVASLFHPISWEAFGVPGALSVVQSRRQRPSQGLKGGRSGGVVRWCNFVTGSTPAVPPRPRSHGPTVPPLCVAFLSLETMSKSIELKSRRDQSSSRWWKGGWGWYPINADSLQIVKRLDHWTEKGKSYEHDAKRF